MDKDAEFVEYLIGLTSDTSPYMRHSGDVHTLPRTTDCCTSEMLSWEMRGTQHASRDRSLHVRDVVMGSVWTSEMLALEVCGAQHAPRDRSLDVRYGGRHGGVVWALWVGRAMVAWSGRAEC